MNTKIRQLRPRQPTGTEPRPATPERRLTGPGSARRLLLAGGFVLALSWMFVMGVLVGRGIPLADSEDTSIRGAALRFLGLGKPAPVVAQENAADTWVAPDRMLSSLQYHDSLTPSEAPGRVRIPDQPQAVQVRPAAVAQAAAVKPASASTTDAQPAPVAEADSSTERYTLMVASMRNMENAERMVKQLAAKGYETSRIEDVEMPDKGRWHRVLVGSFPSREQAMRFAAVFNNKEKMEGLVIRDAR